MMRNDAKRITMADSINTELLQTHVTVDERAQVAARAQADGVSAAAYLRRLIKQDLARKAKK